MIRRLSRLLIVCLAVLLVMGDRAPASPALAQSAPASDRRAGLARALQATVLVLVTDNTGAYFGNGSGAILDAEQGYVLTNYHVLGDRQGGVLYNDEGAAIIGVMPPNLKGAPILKYRATLVAGDPRLDLALLKIDGLLDDPRAELPANLGLTAIERADTDELMIGDTLYVLGYPGLGGNTVTMSAGLVSGFLDEDNDGVFEWIKTDAEVNRGNSGGLAVDEQWRFIGVPTAGVSEVETVGKISLIRTGNLALHFFEAALMGAVARNASSGPRIDAVSFGNAINRENQVMRGRTRFDSGATDIYASFAYAGFRNGQTFGAQWYIDGRQDMGERYTWAEGESGRSWVSIYNENGLRDGFYELELLLDGRRLHRSGVALGGVAEPNTTCRFGAVTFATAIDDDGKPVAAGVRFSNVQTVYALFPVSGMTNGAPWKTVWRYQGISVLERESIWDLGETDTQWVSLSHADGLPIGEFQLELYCAGELQQQAAFEITQRETVRAPIVDVIGVITDRDNKRRRVDGATVLFLQPGVTVRQWVNADYSDALVHGSAVSDRSGAYRLSAPVTSGDRYSVVVVQDRYLPLSEEAVLIPVDALDPYVLDLTMQRK